MSLFFASLNSGSSGNGYYFGNYKEEVRVDAGISCREIDKLMTHIELDMQKGKVELIKIRSS